MPLLRYFCVVGPALLILLLAVNWILPEAIEPVHASTVRPNIRISSTEKLPERVVFDTSLPQVAPRPRVMPPGTELPQSAFAFVQITPGPLPKFLTSAEVAPKSPAIVKRDPARKVANVSFDARSFIEHVGGYSLDSVAMGDKLILPRDAWRTLCLCQLIHRGVTDLAWHNFAIVHHRKCERQTLVVVSQDLAAR
jgi:hypothetical protein